jgi:hypothetical protein
VGVLHGTDGLTSGAAEPNGHGCSPGEAQATLGKGNMAIVRGIEEHHNIIRASAQRQKSAHAPGTCAARPAPSDACGPARHAQPRQRIQSLRGTGGAWPGQVYSCRAAIPSRSRCRP